MKEPRRAQKGPIPRAVLALRTECSLTQAELALAIGKTPMSIYRYEANTSKPDLDAIVGLWEIAQKRGASAEFLFAELIATALPSLKTHLLLPAVRRGMAFNAMVDDYLATALHPQDKCLVEAVLAMLRDTSDQPTKLLARTVVSVCLEPWAAKIPKVKKAKASR